MPASVTCAITCGAFLAHAAGSVGASLAVVRLYSNSPPSCIVHILIKLWRSCLHAVAANKRTESKDGLEVHMQTNHLSHFLLALGLLPALQRGARQPPQRSSISPAGADAPPFRPRIVSVASAMHHFGYKFGPQDPMLKQSYSTTMAYGNSKLCQVKTSAGRSVHFALNWGSS
jgi:NAD(P)-dependent dehydrogenase (short-subunit alcohol dehydrogenase family)